MNTSPVVIHLHTFNTDNEITGVQDTAYYYLPPGCATYADVPIGERFEMASDSRPERVAFEVTMGKYGIDADYCRYYRKVIREGIE